MPKRRSSQNYYSTHSGEYRFSVGAYAPSHFTVSRTFCALGKDSSNSTAGPPKKIVTSCPSTSSRTMKRYFSLLPTQKVSVLMAKSGTHGSEQNVGLLGSEA